MNYWEKFLKLRTENKPLFYVSLVTLFSIVAYAIFNFSLISLGIRSYNFGDFGVYYSAGKQFLNGRPLYDWSYLINSRYLSVTNPFNRFFYPPITVLLFIPFTFLNEFFLSAFLWVLVQFLFLFGGVLYLLRVCGIYLGVKEKLFLILLLLGFQPLMAWVALGQIVGFLSGLFCFSAAFMIKRYEKGDFSDLYDIGSGVFTILASIPKPFYIISGSSILKNQKRLTGGIISLFGLVGISFLIFGINTNLAYVDAVFVKSGIFSGGKNSGLSLFAAAIKIIPFLVIFSLVIFAAIYTREINSVRVDSYFFALALTAIPLINPLHFPTTFSILIPALIIALIWEVRRSNGYPSLVVLSAFMIQIRAPTIVFLKKFSSTLSFLPIKSIISINPAYWGTSLLFAFLFWRCIQISEKSV